ncbi:MAG: FIST N-terminal domain-containing protein [Myxococcota bacterium]
MHWTSSLSTAPDAGVAVSEVVEAASEQLGGAPDLVFAFASRHHRAALPWLPGRLSKELGHAPLLGCAAGGIIGAGREIEDSPALALVAAHLPGVEVAPFFLEPQAVPPPGTATSIWNARLGIPKESAPSFVVIPDPFTCRVGDFVQALDHAFPSATVVGGMASGGNQPGENSLFFGNEVHRGGVVGVALSGNVVVETVVAQGCRPVGAPMFVTRGSGNVIAELDGRSPSQVLQELYAAANIRDQRLMRTALHMGVVMTEAQEVYRHGDFLIRNIVALDGQSGAVGVASPIESGQVVQFHIRDAQTSAEDLDNLLAEHCAKAETPAGALLFSCLGRGTGLYGEPDHDSLAFAQHAGGAPLGGFFCSGEIGPIAGKTHLHGYTSAFALFRRRRAN